MVELKPCPSHKVGKVNVIVSTTQKFGYVGAYIPDWKFGKTVFLTRDEAEKALEEREEKKYEII